MSALRHSSVQLARPQRAKSGHVWPLISEYPTDYLVGICIDTSAMAQQNTLRLPRVDFFDRRLCLLPLPHPEENLTVWMVHPRELCGRPPKLGYFVKFKVDDRVGEYQRL